jgi:ADP-heptose:LPS heptosyltransferase/predicted SAM-dependent methyltransferase
VTWNLNDPQGNESGKIKWEIVRWTRGRGLDLGCGIQKTFPHFIGVDNGKDGVLFGHPINPDVRVETAAALPMFASSSMDFVFSSHLLEHFPLDTDPRQFSDQMQRLLAAKLGQDQHSAVDALKEWMRVIKVGGHLVLYVPDEDEYPKVGTEGSNPDHCLNLNYEAVCELMRKTRTAWRLVDYQKRNQDREYSLFFVFQKTNAGQDAGAWAKTLKERKTDGRKTCGLVRYGAFGDLLQCSSVLRQLAKAGYRTTVFTSPPGDEVIRHDPHIDAFYLQDKDQVPNHLLGEFWGYHAKQYDKWVNLSESVECNLLAVPGRSTHFWSPAARHRYMDHNYVEMQHAIAGVPFDPHVQFFATPTEQQWAKRERAKLGGDPLVCWSLAGSSIHKTWGGLDATIASILLDFPSAHVVFVGGPDAVILEQGWEKEPRVLRRSGQYQIRETLALLDTVDVLIGPETGVMNAGSQLKIPKVVFLSHSTANNLTRDWVNTTTIASANTTCPGRGANEAPACHQLHYGWDYCKQFRKEGDPQDGTAQCQADIDGAAAYRAIHAAIKGAILAKEAAA